MVPFLLLGGAALAGWYLFRDKAVEGAVGAGPISPEAAGLPADLVECDKKVRSLISMFKAFPEMGMAAKTAEFEREWNEFLATVKAGRKAPYEELFDEEDGDFENLKSRLTLVLKTGKKADGSALTPAETVRVKAAIKMLDDAAATLSSLRACAKLIQSKYMESKPMTMTPGTPSGPSDEYLWNLCHPTDDLGKAIMLEVENKWRDIRTDPATFANSADAQAKILASWAIEKDKVGGTRSYRDFATCVITKTMAEKNKAKV